MDEQEMERVARTYGPDLYRLAYARTGSHADAQDVMQETLLRLVRNNPTFESENHCKAWLLRVAANCVGDVFRSPWRHAQPLSESLPAPERPEEGGVLEAVLALPPRDRAAVHLYYYEGYSTPEIAAMTGQSEGTVRSRLARARQKLRALLADTE